MGVARRSIEDREIVERLEFALANEGALILEEGIAARVSDIDVVLPGGLRLSGRMESPVKGHTTTDW